MFVIEAIVLGLLVAVNPCQIAINISALTYLNNRSAGHAPFMQACIKYAAGRVTTYTLLGIVLMLVWQAGIDIEAVRRWLSQGEQLLPYIFIIIGVFMIYRVFHHHDHHGEQCHNCGQTIRRSGPSGALVLGLMLAFAFCPESAVIYFGMMMPLAISHTAGMAVPVAFAVASVLPVMLVAYLMSKADQRLQMYAQHFKRWQQIINAVTGIAFIAAAIILFIG